MAESYFDSLTEEQQAELERAPRIASLGVTGAWNDLRAKIEDAQRGLERQLAARAKQRASTQDELLAKEIRLAELRGSLQAMGELLRQPERAKQLVSAAEKAAQRYENQRDGDESEQAV